MKILTLIFVFSWFCLFLVDETIDKTIDSNQPAAAVENAQPDQPPADNAQAPEPGYSANVTILDVYDGDTVTAEVKMVMRIRLRDCWAPERKGDQKQDGLKAREVLMRIAPAGSTGRLFVPFDNNQRLDKAFTFGRPLGYLWMDDDLEKSINQKMVESGWATKEKMPVESWPIRIQSEPQ